MYGCLMDWNSVAPAAGPLHTTAESLPLQKRTSRRSRHDWAQSRGCRRKHTATLLAHTLLSDAPGGEPSAEPLLLRRRLPGLKEPPAGRTGGSGMAVSDANR
jgi:hypothetical protein